MRYTNVMLVLLSLVVHLGLADEILAESKRVRLGESLDRAVVARPIGEGKVYVGWRLLKSDPEEATA